MKNINKELIAWVIKEIENEYNGEISLLLGRKGARMLPSDSNDMTFDFFIPASDHGYSLSRTFIIGDMGYDLFPMSWERVGGLATLNERIAFCLADSEILYARNEADKEHFELLQKTLFNNLKDIDFVSKKSLEKINFAMDIYKTMMFEMSFGNTRKAAGVITGYLLEALVIINGTYVKRDYGYWNIVEQVNELKNVPVGFTDIYEKILRAEDIDAVKNLVHCIIGETRNFFKQFVPQKKPKNYDFDELAGWYEESRYTFRRIAYACKNNQIHESFTLGCYLQIELDILTEEAGLDKMDLLASYNADDLSAFEKRSEEIEEYILNVIKKHGVKLRKYDNLEDFLKHQK